MYSLAFLLLFAPILLEAKSKCEGIVWTHDDKLNMCLAKHCCKAAKGERSFPSYVRCNDWLMMDYFSCGGGVQHKTMCNRMLQLHPSPPPLYGYATPPTVAECPKGDTCIWGPFGFGFCCDEKNEEVWRKNYAATCDAPLKTVHMSQPDVTDQILRGKSCSDLFCPKGTKCVQGKYIAHCCT